MLWTVLLAGVAFCAGPSRAQENPSLDLLQNDRDTTGHDEPPIDLLHADRYTLDRTGGQEAHYLEGNVHFRQGTAELWADRAVWFKETAESHLYGRVRIVDTAETLTADTVIYLEQQALAFAYGNVYYTRPQDELEARSARAEYNRSDETARFYQDAQMIYRGDNPAARLETLADTLVFNSGSDTLRALGHVQIVRTDGIALAERALFIAADSTDRMLLYGQPEGTFEGNDVSGDSLELILQDDELRTLFARGQARATYREVAAPGEDPAESDISSDEMRLDFSGGVLKNMTAVGQARSHYVPSWGRPGESNDASGDTVKIELKDELVHRVQVISGAQGTYYSPSGEEDRLDTIRYESAYIDYHVDQNWIRLWDRAKIDYGVVTLDAGQVLYQTDSAVLRAYAIDDSLLPPPTDYGGHPSDAATDSLTIRDSTGTVDPMLLMRQRMAESGPARRGQQPTLRDGSQEVRGDRLVYEISTRRGRIVHSSTAAQDGYYHGKDFRKESDNTFFVRQGRYTTCELDQPHFYFQASKMKIRDGDRVVARPVVLKIEELPVLWIPYYVFSIKKDRHSGLLPIRFGNFERGSRYVRNLGYYFAVSEYFDFAPAVDLVENEGVLWHLATSYAWRYHLTGSLFASYNKHTRTTAGPSGPIDQTTKRWNLIFTHNQQITPSLTLAGLGNFVSDNSFYQDFTADPSFRLNRSLRSQINLNKRWKSSSLILAAEDTRNLDNNNRQSLLPRLTLSIPQRQVLTPRKLKGGRTEPARWYHNFRIGYNSLGQNVINEREVTQSRSVEVPDTSGGLDTVLVTDTVVTGDHYATWDHRASLNYSSKWGGVVNVTPSVNLQETWYYVFDSRNDTLPTDVNANTFYRRLSGNASVRTQTNLYGIFPLRVGPLEGFRHVFTPTLGLTFTPPVTENQAVRNYTGVGGGGPTRSRVLSVGLGNLIQMKTRSGEQERRWDLLNVNISSAYNFEATTRKWSNITTSIRSGLVRNPDIAISLSHDPYDPVTGELDYTPRLASINTSVGFRFSGQLGNLSALGGPEHVIYEPTGGADFIGSSSSLGGQGGATGRQSWDFQANYQFSEARAASGQKTISHWIRPTFRFNPTTNWEVQTNLYYDIRNQTMNDWTLRLHRTLHCWEAEFSWVITGARAGYYFKVNVIRLGDLKFEKSESGIRDALFGAIPGL